MCTRPSSQARHVLIVTSRDCSPIIATTRVMLRRSSRLERAADAPSPQIPEQTKAPSRKRQKTAVQPESDEQEVQVDRFAKIKIS
jgi:hypothetical protein